MINLMKKWVVIILNKMIINQLVILFAQKKVFLVSFYLQIGQGQKFSKKMSELFHRIFTSRISKDSPFASCRSIFSKQRISIAI
jgi:hypothetical protein